jgi:hypothetical protein
MPRGAGEPAKGRSQAAMRPCFPAIRLFGHAFARVEQEGHEAQREAQEEHDDEGDHPALIQSEHNDFTLRHGSFLRDAR